MQITVPCTAVDEDPEDAWMQLMLQHGQIIGATAHYFQPHYCITLPTTLQPASGAQVVCALLQWVYSERVDMDTLEAPRRATTSASRNLPDKEHEHA